MLTPRATTMVSRSRSRRYWTLWAASPRLSMSPSLPIWHGGYAEEPQDVAENMRRILRAGAVGINLEDSVHEGERLFEVEFQCARIRAVRDMAREEGVPLFINA